MQKVRVERILDAPPETVFARYTDHGGWSRWAGVGKVFLIQQGTETRDGTGAVREFASAMGLREEVVSFEPPARMSYRVVHGGFPLKNHLGQVEFEPHPRGTKVVWSASFDSKIPLTGKPLAWFVDRVFVTLLARFEAHGMKD